MRSSPKLALVSKTRKLEPEVGWRFYDRVEPGDYPAYSRFAHIYRDPAFGRWTCLVLFDLLNDSLSEVTATVPWFLNLADNDKPYAGRRGKFFQAWVQALGRRPVRSDRPSSKIFLNRHATVLVADSRDGTVSKVKTVLHWDTGSTR
jgi:hypothetical protein